MRAMLLLAVVNAGEIREIQVFKHSGKTTDAKICTLRQWMTLRVPKGGAKDVNFVGIEEGAVVDGQFANFKLVGFKDGKRILKQWSWREKKIPYSYTGHTGTSWRPHGSEPVAGANYIIRARIKETPSADGKWGIKVDFDIVEDDSIQEIQCQEIPAIKKAYVIQDDDPTKLPLPKGYHHAIWDQTVGAVEPEVWFHGLEKYNIAVECFKIVKHLKLEGYYYRLDGEPARIDYDEELSLKEKMFSDVKSSKRYNFLNGDEERTKKEKYVDDPRQKQGNILLEAGEYHLKLTAYDWKMQTLQVLEETVQIRANPQRKPIFDEGVVLEVEEWKDIQKWQTDLRALFWAGQDPGPDFVTRRFKYTNWRLSSLCYFKSFVYIIHEKWGTIFKVDPDDETSTVSGLKLFLDVKDGIEREDGGNSELGNAVLWHAGVRSVAFHPLGDDIKGRCYVSAMEVKPTAERLAEMGPEKMKYIERTTDFVPIDEESVVIEFLYDQGMGRPETYRLLFRVECPVYDHTVRQLAFNYFKNDNRLYILHGDGSVESELVGDAQNLDGLGKIYCIDPLDGTNDIRPENVLEWGQYSTTGNPFDFTDPQTRPMPAVPGPIDKMNPKFGPVPKETYAFGFRNPHSMTFDNQGNFIIAEAGRDTFEEINVIVKGGDYGWSYFDGTYVHTQLRGDQTKNLFYSSYPITDPAKEECQKCNFRWPAVAWGHAGFEGMEFNNIALAGGPVIENGSPIHNAVNGQPKYFYCDFPYTGLFYYSYLSDLLTARDTGLLPLSEHQEAPTYHAQFLFNGVKYTNFRDVMRQIFPAYDVPGSKKRVDLRIGRDDKGTMYILTKDEGVVFKVTNTAPSS